ncbi:MAG TPA: folylpolyglutamate synthase/dihydrofolate synthase family protein [Sphingobacteriaceae bacterium]|nr:folylpolyglutamate synthase/dihydrofolate synthase family protein [Sphingobacteriaceae bacterium]
MSYQETINYLYDRLPMFSKQGASAIKKDLVNIKKLCEALGNPHQHFKSIHVAGTNGKGSTSHMLAAILQTAGYKTGLYTSPHLLDFRERIRINGEMIGTSEVISFVDEHKSLFEEIEPSFFEVTVAMAFDYFAKQDVDFAIIETGLGGRLDSTNIINPVLSIITNISLDHINILGNSVEEIAAEKAGIIKEHIPVVISEKTKETAPIFEETAHEKASKITFASDVCELSIIKNEGKYLEILAQLLTENHKAEVYHLDLTGSYQKKNLAGVLLAIDELSSLGHSISQENIHDGLANVKALTGLMGRWQTLGESPLIICDTGHNEKGWEEILININQQEVDHLHMVIGVMRDKDIESLLNILPREASYYFCRANFERSLPEKDLLELAQDKNLKGISYKSIAEAIQAAKANANKTDLIFIGGSTFVVAEALEYFI